MASSLGVQQLRHRISPHPFYERPATSRRTIVSAPMSKPVATHIAYVLKRETRTSWRWLEIGIANIETDGKNGAHHVEIDRLPVGGFGGKIRLQPIGVRPPEPPAEQATDPEHEAAN